VENRLSRVEVAGSLFVLHLVVMFYAAVALAPFVGLHYFKVLIKLSKVFENALSCAIWPQLLTAVKEMTLI
jgi:hypothetical protein